MDDIYGVFKGHVTENRGKKLKKPIDELAGGRVYTGRQGLELGLVDRIGTLQDAINYAAEQAKITSNATSLDEKGVTNFIPTMLPKNKVQE